MSHPNPAQDSEDDWEEFEDDSETGICRGCRDHAVPVYLRHKITGETGELIGSNCCGEPIWLP